MAAVNSFGQIRQVESLKFIPLKNKTVRVDYVVTQRVPDILQDTTETHLTLLALSCTKTEDLRDSPGIVECIKCTTFEILVNPVTKICLNLPMGVQ